MDDFCVVGLDSRKFWRKYVRDNSNCEHIHICGLNSSVSTMLLHAIRPRTRHNTNLTVGFLVPCPRTWSTKLLGLRPSRIRNKQSPIICNQSLFELILAVLIHVFLVIRNDSFCDGLTDGVNLRSVSSTGNTNTNIHVGKLIQSNDQKGFVDLLVSVTRLELTLKRRISGWTRDRGEPLTLIRPLPVLQNATAVAV